MFERLANPFAQALTMFVLHQFHCKKILARKCDLWHSLRFRGWSQDFCGAHFGKDKAVCEISVNRSVSNMRNHAHMCYRLSHAKNRKLELRLLPVLGANLFQNLLPSGIALDPPQSRSECHSQHVTIHTNF